MEPIAVTGRGCVVPGALDPDAFWDNVASGRCSLSPAEPGGYVRDFDAAFDPHGFALDADEIMRLDPLFRWVLHVARQALREAGRPPGPLPRAGLVLGNLSYPSAGLTRFAEQVWRAGGATGPAEPRDRFSSGLPAHLAARALGLGAGAFALDAACASALYAVKLACDRLQDGSADLMLAGAVTCPDRLLIQAGFTALAAASPTGRSRPFHRAADGLVAGEGAALVALMRLDDAIAAGVPVLGVIRGAGLSNDGRGGGLLVPAEEGQVRAMRRAYEEAGVPPETVSLVECHATGTPVGDAVEVRSMARVFAASADLPVGSVKSNVGHLLAAAGGAGLLKILGAMRAGVRPASLAAEEPIEGLDGAPLRLLAEAEDWPGPRRAAVSAFGFGGANAHLVVDAWPPASRPAVRTAPPPGEPVAITGIGARVADGAGADDFRRAVMLGERALAERTAIDVALPGLRFPPRDLESAHAQQVLLLEAAREAAAGASLPRERTLVVAGMGVDPEVARYPVLRRAGPGLDAPPLLGAEVLGTMPNLVANRVNVQLDLAGPGYTVSAEEASGLVALDLARRALQAGEVDAALVGAVDLSCEPVHGAASRALGRERPPGDAAVVLVLERLADARRRGRPVHAVLAGDLGGGSAPELVVGDPGPAAGGFDPAELFGVAHAAHGLVAVAAAATAVRHGALLRAGGLAVPACGELGARVVVESLEAPSAAVRLRPGGPAEAWAPGPAPRLHVYSGADRAAVVEALAAGRESGAGPARLAIVAEGHAALPERARAARRWLTRGGPRPDGVAFRDAPAGGEVAFVFTNGSATYPGMGAELALALPALAGRLGPPPSGGRGALDRIVGAAWLGSLHVEVTRGLLGVRPDAAIGYSSGESAALVALGAWTDPTALHRDLRRSELFTAGLTGELRAVRRVWQRAGLSAGRWASHLVNAPAEQVRAALAGEPAVHLLAVNAPGVCVVGGEASACESVLRRLGDAPTFPIDYDIAAHCPELAEVGDEYRALHLRPTRDVPGVRFYSGATGEPYRVSAERAADALLAQILGTVDFVRVIERAWADGVRVFVEHGPQAQCTGWIRRILEGRDHVAVALDAPGGRGLRQLCRAAADLVVAGVAVDTAALFDRLAVAAEPAPVGRAETIRLAAHPPPLSRIPPTTRDSGWDVRSRGGTRLSLPSPEPDVVPMPRAPRLPPVLDAASDGPPARPARRLAPVAASPPAAEAVPAVARLVASQLQQATALHGDFLARQAEAHARFLNGRQEEVAALTRLALAAGRPAPVAGPSPPAGRALPGPAFDRRQLEQLAVGPLSDLFGPRFAVLDELPRRTRLPSPPLLLVDRVTGIDAVPASMGTGTISTETDVALDGWYLDATGRMPAGLMIEAGQADLLLISWLGVDLVGDGERVYRLLGCELTYHGSPAAAGETLRYEIHVDGHAQHGDVRLFFFRYDCSAGGEPRMTVRNGQAGFFTDDELAHAEGLRWDPAESEPAGGPPAPPAAAPGRRFDHDAVRAFAEGRPADCFGPAWDATRAHVRTPRIDSGQLLLLGAVTGLDPAGGPWGRGYLRAETTVTAGDWFFAGHFDNDPCMPGTLMFQGGLQAMAFYLAALGFTIDRDGWRFEPVPEEPCLLRCRGQVSPASRRIVYEVFVSELTLDPVPTLHADVLGTVDGVRAFHARRAGLRLVPDWPLDHWRQLGPPAVQATGEPVPLPELGGLRGHAAGADGRAVLAGPVRQDYAALLACAWGRLTQAVGPTYARFDGPRRAPRLPGPPYHFMTRIVEIDGELGGMRVGSAVTAEYEVPLRAWYFEQNGAPTMPFAILMETALQPCGWLAMYVGSVLSSETDLLFRNLDGTGTVLREVGPGTPGLRTRVELREISRFGDVILESFSARCAVAGGPADGAPVLEMETVFGFFPRAAFAEQAGLPPTAGERARLLEPCAFGVDLRARPGRYCEGTARLGGPMLLALDRVTGYWPEGGRAGLGRVRAEKDVDPGEWFFRAHFFQDPVQPGSLGVEAMCQLLQWYLIERGAAASLARPRFEPIMLRRPVTWRYRGQVVPADRLVTIELEITGAGEDATGRHAIADGWLWVDGRRIYGVSGLGMRVVPGETAAGT